MTREERNAKLKHFITCLKCEVSGKECDDNCPIQYEAGNMGEIIENLEAISKALEQEPCEDAISREATLKPYNGLNDEDTISVWLIRKNIEQQPPVTPQPKWIPVSEGLPNRDEYIKNNGLFIVSDGNRSYSEWFDIYDKQRFGEPTMSGFRVDYAVTAWMPLPEPYREDGTE